LRTTKNVTLTTSVLAIALALGGCPGDDDTMTMPPGTPGVTVDPTSGLMTTEAGGTDTFTVVLDSPPNADVTISIASDNEDEGTASPSSLTFTVDNWNAPQTVTVTGVDDEATDGDVMYTIETGAAVSDDADYSGMTVADVEVTNNDNETAGITLSMSSGLVTSEAGGTDTFTVVLDSQPTADVTIPVASGDEGEITVSAAELTFTTDNWNAPQEVTLTGVDDDEVDGDVDVTITVGPATSTDSAYDGENGGDVSATNLDDESAGGVVSETELTVAETGTTATFTVVLNAAPSADVEIPLSSDDEGEVTVSPATLTFTSENFDAPQTVTVTGVDDDIADGDQVSTVVVGAATSEDAGYDGLDLDDVEVTNTDDDSAGVTVDPTSELATTEAGGTDTFTVVLNTMPSADVVFAVSSSDTGEATVAPAELTFTADNWAAPQTVTVTGVDDALVDGAQPFTIMVGAATSTDAAYDGVDPTDPTGTNGDDDTPGVTVTPVDGLTTTEGGGSDTFTVVLVTQPLADVSFPVMSDDDTEGTTDVDTLTFTADNWDAPQTVTVTGEDDAAADGAQVYNVVVGAGTSTDAAYDGFDPADVEVTNTDDDSAGVTVTPTTGLLTSEDLTDAEFTIVLNSRPTADVTFTFSSSDVGEGTVSPAMVTFTTDNWDAPRTITVTGVDDPVADGDVPYMVVTSAATSTDADYDGIDPSDVSLTNDDNDSPGITVTPTTGLVTTEAGGTATFTVVLDSQPSADVTIDLASDDTTEGIASPMTLTFTTANWNAPQTVTVTGQADAVFDGDQPYTIVLDPAASTDTDYDMVDPADVSVTNDDNDPGVTVTPTTGLGITEAGGTATFTVVLNTMPSNDVSISITSADLSEGTVSPSSLTFTSANFAAPQTVTVTGVDDDIADGDQVFDIVTARTVSSDLSYDNLPVADVEVTNTDDESAGFLVAGRPGNNTTTEAGGTDSFTIALTSEPTADVTIPISTRDPDEVSVSPAMLVFTPANWNAPQVVTLTGVDDAIADGDQPFAIVTDPAMSADPNYDGLDPRNAGGVNNDDETAGITVDRMTVVTREDGTARPTFRVRLDSEPTADVTVPVVSGDTSEGLTDPMMLTFTAANWNAFQTVTVTGQDDAVADGDQAYNINVGPASSTDVGYDGLDAPDVAGTNIDNDSAGITVDAAPGIRTTEEGGTTTFNVVLNSQPTADVTIGLTSSDTTEGTVSPVSLLFTSSNWDAPQVVTVTGADDFVADGDQPYLIITAAASSADANYNGRNPADVLVTNVDDESPGFVVDPVAGLRTTEAGGTDTFTVRLTSQPTADVTLTIDSSDTGEGTVSPISLRFTSLNWNAPQTVTVTGADDFVQDGLQGYTIITSAASSADGNYDGRNPADVSVENVDDETAGVTVTAMAGLQTTEAGGEATFTVRLDSEPLSNVTIDVSSGDTSEGTVSPATLTFTPANWNAPQTVTATGVDDFVQDGNQIYFAITSNAMSGDSDYDGLNVDDVALTNVDDETAGISVTPTSGLIVNEAGTVTATFDVVLRSQPTRDVTVPIGSSDTGEGTPSPSSLTFTSANWDTPQTVTVTGANDDVADGNQTFNATVGPATSMDDDYDGLSGANVSVTNLDDETPGISVSATGGFPLVVSENGAMADFEIVLNSEPTDDVVITLTTNPDEASLSSSMLTFTAANWNVPQTVTVTGEDDAIADGTQLFNIDGNPSGSSDADYAALSPFQVDVLNLDND